MTTPEQCLVSLVKFEQAYHKEILLWIQTKVSKPPSGIDILDISLDNCVFSSLLKNSMKANSLTTVVRGDDPTDLIEKSIKQLRVPSLSKTDLSAIKSLGAYDLIILHDVIHEAETYSELFEAMKSLLKDDDSRIYLLARPKNPPLPIPDVAVPVWRKLTPSRDELIKAIRSARMGQIFYSVSCPIKVSKEDWHNILKLRPYHALRKCPKCTDKEIRNYVESMRPFVLFEEKIFILLMTPRPEQGEKMPPDESDAQEEDSGIKLIIGHQPDRTESSGKQSSKPSGGFANPNKADEAARSVLSQKNEEKVSLTVKAAGAH